MEDFILQIFLNVEILIPRGGVCVCVCVCVCV